MKTRVITAIIIGILFVPPFIIGGWYLSVMLLILAIGGTLELFKLYNTKEKLPFYLGGIYALFTAFLYWMIQSYYMNLLMLEWVFLFIVLILVVGSLLLVFVDEFHSHRIGEMVVAILYPAFGFGAIFALRYFDLYTIGFLFLITISTDIFAYIIGINFGKHRLAIKISPKKSIEGSIGGTAFALLFTMLYIWGFDLEFIGEIELNVWISIVLIVFISIIGQIGDLVFSKLKRHMDVKDFSNVFPGHGGVLDRFDSVLFAGMVLMLISKVVGIV